VDQLRWALGYTSGRSEGGTRCPLWEATWRHRSGRRMGPGKRAARPAGECPDQVLLHAKWRGWPQRSIAISTLALNFLGPARQVAGVEVVVIRCGIDVAWEGVAIEDATVRGDWRKWLADRLGTEPDDICPPLSPVFQS
jgi:hypothetical protein